MKYKIYGAIPIRAVFLQLPHSILSGMAILCTHSHVRKYIYISICVYIYIYMHACRLSQYTHLMHMWYMYKYQQHARAFVLPAFLSNQD